MILASWVLTLFVLALWTLAAWGLHALLTLDATRVGELKPLVDQIPYGEAISQWIPGWQDLLRLSIDLTQATLGWVGDAAPIVVGVVWGVGALAILAVGVLLTLLVQFIRRSGSPGVAGKSDRVGAT
jgi:hypothetical protein